MTMKHIIKEYYRRPTISVISVEKESLLLTNGNSTTNGLTNHTTRSSCTITLRGWVQRYGS